jgi:hypothetical protein
MLLAILFYIKGINKNNNKLLLLGSVFSALSFLTKQYGIVIPISLAIYMSLTYKRNDLRLKKILFTYSIPLLVLCVYALWYFVFHLPDSLIVFYYSLSDTGGSPWGISSRLRNILRSLFAILLYLGLFITPLLLGSLPAIGKFLGSSKIRVFSIAIIAVAIPLCLYLGNPGASLMPYGIGILHSWGLGPITIPGDKAVFFSPFQRLILTTISAFSALALAVILSVQFLRLFGKDRRNVIFISWLLQLFFIMLLLPGTGDHNFVYLLPGVILGAIGFLEKIEFNKTLMALGLVPLAFYSILGTKDYINWNDVRWKMTNELLEEGIPPNEIEGGYEWGALILSERALQKRKEELKEYQGDRHLLLRWILHIEPRYDPRYVISFSPILRRGDYLHRFSALTDISGIKSKWEFDAFRKASYYNALKFRRENIYVLKRRGLQVEELK